MFFTGILLVIFATSIGYATFIENDYGTLTAKILVYNAWWFELLFLVIGINLVSSIFVNKLISKKKWTIFLFHAAFIILIAGAAITRYYGFEGTMHIREGETSDFIISESTFITLTALSGEESAGYEEEVRFSGNTANRFSGHLEVEGKSVSVENLQFVPSALESIAKDGLGEPAVAMMAFSNRIPRIDFSLTQKTSKVIDGVQFAFRNEIFHSDILLSEHRDSLHLVASDSVMVSDVMNNQSETVPPGERIPLSGRKIYQFRHLSFLFKQYYPGARIQLSYLPPENNKVHYDAFLARVTVDGESGNVAVSGRKGQVGEPQYIHLNGVRITIRYGSKKIPLPFSIRLNDFQLERYPGSNSPSSYASEVVLTDKKESLEKPFRIFMNNILIYKGYRFFQSSYDPDEQGTILSVNHDKAGTTVTYFGYLLLALGMILTLFNPHSRFRKLARASAALHARRKKLLMVILAGMIFTLANAQPATQDNWIDREHIREFSRLLVQNNRGRIEPVNTLASEILRKVAKTNRFNDMSACEVFLKMQINPEKWVTIPVIQVGHPELRKRLGTNQKLVPFNLIVTSGQTGGYRISNQVQQAYAKKPAERNKFDKEVLNVDERVHILMNVFSGNFLTILPVPGHPNDQWVSANRISDTGGENAEWAENTVNNYFSAVQEGIHRGDWSKANTYLTLLKENQKKYSPHLIPPELKVNLEVFDLNFNIFGKLSLAYLIIGFLFLFQQLVLLFKPSIKTGWVQKTGVFLAIILFTAHTLGLGIRWYISGHAPWSNSYESMLFISWGTLLAGLIFSRRSQITLALTMVLAALALLVAGMSWMSPEITNLVPVLKSYWLIVHVAVITSSYGFLGISALLGTLNLVLIILRSKKNIQRVNFTIQELAYIIQMALILGLFMLTLGSFLGGVWANESWGRYWGWDPKETWSLVTILVYTFILHMHKIKGFRGVFALSNAALVGFFSVLMTYFGVNYYLTGLHSYAGGEPVPIPTGVYLGVLMVLLLIIAGFVSEKKWNRQSNASQKTSLTPDSRDQLPEPENNRPLTNEPLKKIKAE